MTNFNKIEPLSDNFYNQTRKLLLNFIEEKGLEAYLVTNPANIFYFTGFFYVTNERPSGFYISKDNKSKLFIPLLEKENSENTVVDNILIYEEFPGKINPYSFMAGNINEKNIGTDINNIKIIDQIKNNFQKLDYQADIKNFRYQKLEEEINLISEAAKYADLTLEFLKDHADHMINNQTNERELVKFCTEEAKKEMLNNLSADFDETPCNVVATIHSGPRGDFPHGKSLSRIPKKK